MTIFLLLIAYYFSGEVTDDWDVYPGTDPVNGDEMVAWVVVALLTAAFIAWAVERIADAIKATK